MSQIPPPTSPQQPDWIVTRQWEQQVRQMVLKSAPRQQIVGAMLQSGWPEQQAQAMVGRIAGSERNKAIGIIAASGVFCLLGLLALVGVMVGGGRGAEGIIYWIPVLVCGVIGVGIGIGRLGKIKA